VIRACDHRIEAQVTEHRHWNPLISYSSIPELAGDIISPAKSGVRHGKAARDVSTRRHYRKTLAAAHWYRRQAPRLSTVANRAVNIRSPAVSGAVAGNSACVITSRLHRPERDRHDDGRDCTFSFQLRAA